MTMPEPIGQPRRMPTHLEDVIRRIEQDIQQLRARPLTRAGEFTTQSPSGVTTFFTGPYYGAPEPDGSPQWITVIRDINHAARLVFWDPNPNDGSYVQAEWHWDHLGNLVWTTDNNGGWAEPHLPIVLYSKLAPPTVTAGAPFGWHYLNAASAGTEQVCWSGDIGYVSHSRVWLKGLWGGTSGTAEYKLKVAGVTIGTWTTNAGVIVEQGFGPFNLLAATTIGAREVRIEVTARRTSGSGDIACQMIHCHQRQS